MSNKLIIFVNKVNVFYKHDQRAGIKSKQVVSWSQAFASEVTGGCAREQEGRGYLRGK